MSTVQGTVTEVSGDGKVKLVSWALAQGDDGAMAQWTEYADRCFQVAGTFGGASVTIQGSNDTVNWAPLSDPQGNPLTFTSSKIEQALELPRFVRPFVNGGDGTTALTVTLCMRK